MSPTPAAIAKRYFETVGEQRSAEAEAPPVCVYLEVTNRCNLLCETCPRTFEDLEPPADMSWPLFTSIIDQLPGLARAVLHGVGEPMLVKDLPRMIRYLKDRGVYVLVQHQRHAARAEEAPRAHRHRPRRAARFARRRRCAESFFKVRGKDMFEPHRAQCRASSPRCSARSAPPRRASRCGSPASRKRSISCPSSCASPRGSACARCISSASSSTISAAASPAPRHHSSFDQAQQEEAGASPRRKSSAARSASPSTPRARPSPASA